MITVPIDIILKISERLTDHEKIYLTMVSTYMDNLKHKIKFTEKIGMAKIKKLKYFNNFEFVEIFDGTDECPKFVKHVYFYAITLNIPQFVTHLRFNYFFDQPIKKYDIPRTVTHLTFGFNFNQRSKKCVPPSIIHLTFGYLFDQSIEDSIPSSVTHLTLGQKFNRSIRDGIPSSVTHLTFGNKFNHSINSLSKNIIEITLSEWYNKPINKEIRRRINIKRI